jgi:hypothetical protein
LLEYLQGHSPSSPIPLPRRRLIKPRPQQPKQLLRRRRRAWLAPRRPRLDLAGAKRPHPVSKKIGLSGRRRRKLLDRDWRFPIARRSWFHPRHRATSETTDRRIRCGAPLFRWRPYPLRVLTAINTTHSIARRLGCRPGQLQTRRQAGVSIDSGAPAFFWARDVNQFTDGRWIFG